MAEWRRPRPEPRRRSASACGIGSVSGIAVRCRTSCAATARISPCWISGSWSWPPPASAISRSASSAADLAVVERRRLADRAQQRRPLHLRQEILGLVDRLGEALEPRADAEELRAHGHDGVEALRRLLLQADQNVDEQLRLVAAVLPGEAEQLLELIDQDADVVVLAAAEQFGERGRCTPAEVQDAWISWTLSVVARRLSARRAPWTRFATARRAAACRQVRQSTPPRARSCSSCASTPARISELLPHPNRRERRPAAGGSSRSMTSSVIRSRPKKIGHSSVSKGRRPG